MLFKQVYASGDRTRTRANVEVTVVVRKFKQTESDAGELGPLNSLLFVIESTLGSYGDQRNQSIFVEYPR